MGAKVIADLEQRLYDLSHILKTMIREYALILEHSDDENVSVVIENSINEMKDAQKGVSDLFDAIASNHDSLVAQWYNEPECVSSLKEKVDDLESSIGILLTGNDQFVSEVSK